MTIIPLVLSGGTGTRLWPLSRASKPKQFLRLGGERSLFQETLLRCRSRIFDSRPIVIGAHAHRFLIADDLNEHRRFGRNPARAAAAQFLCCDRRRLFRGPEARTRRDGPGARSRSSYSGLQGLFRSRRRGGRRCTGGSSGHLRRSAGPAGDRLRLYPARRAASRSRERWAASSRSRARKRQLPASPRAISGTAAISCFAPMPSCPSSRTCNRI